MAAIDSSRRVYLLWGEEETRKRAALEELLNALVPPENQELDVEFLDGTHPELTGEAILSATRDRGMFSEHRVVVVRSAGRLRPPRHVRTQDVLAAGLEKIPEFSTLILVADAEDSTDRTGRAPFLEKLMSALKSNGTILEFRPLSSEDLARLAVREAASAGKRLSPTVAATLVQRVGNNSQEVLHEVRKLVNFVGPRDTILPTDVAELIAAPADENVFHMLEAALAGNTKEALTILQAMEHAGVSPHMVMTLVGRTLRQLVQARYLQDRGVPPTADAASVSLDILAELPAEGCLYPRTPEWLRQRLWGQAARFSWPALQAALDQLTTTEAGTKGWEHGIENADLALEVFVVSVAQSVRPGRPGRSSFRPAPR